MPPANAAKVTRMLLVKISTAMAERWPAGRPRWAPCCLGSPTARNAAGTTPAAADGSRTAQSHASTEAAGAIGTECLGPPAGVPHELLELEPRGASTGDEAV